MHRFHKGNSGTSGFQSHDCCVWIVGQDELFVSSEERNVMIITALMQEIVVSYSKINVKNTKGQGKIVLLMFQYNPKWLLCCCLNQPIQHTLSLSFTKVLPKHGSRWFFTPIDQNNLLCGTSEVKSVPVHLNLVQGVIKACQTNLISESINFLGPGTQVQKWNVLGVRKLHPVRVGEEWMEMEASDRNRYTSPDS